MFTIVFFLLMSTVSFLIYKFRKGINSFAQFDSNFPIFAIIGIIVSIQCIVLLGMLERISPGEVGVVVNLLGSESGAEDKELTVGYHILPPWKSLYLFPIFEQNHQWIGEDGFSFQTSEGLSVHADIGITFNLVPTRIHELFRKYRRGMEEITHLFIRNNVRDAINKAASRMKIEEILGPRKEEFFKDIQDAVRAELDPLGFNVSHIYILGQLNVPDVVKEALNKKIEATQRAQQRENELRETEAQARKEVALAEGQAKAMMVNANAEGQSRLIRAKAESEANDMISKSLTKQMLEFNSINKWDGKLPHAMSSGNMPFILPLGNSKE